MYRTRFRVLIHSQFRRHELVTVLETYTDIVVQTVPATRTVEMGRLATQGIETALIESGNISELLIADVSSACNCLYSDGKIKPATTKVVFKKTATLTSTTTTTEMMLAPAVF